MIAGIPYPFVALGVVTLSWLLFVAVMWVFFIRKER